MRAERGASTRSKASAGAGWAFLAPSSWLLAMLLLLALPGCSALPADDPPVADSTMVEVLIDFHLAAARNDLRGDLAPAERDAILARHGLDTLQYRHIMAYYAEHPAAYADLYATVLDRLSAERAEHNNRFPRTTPPAPKE